jgi:hypothetical protein
MLSQLDFCQKNSILFLTENHFFQRVMDLRLVHGRPFGLEEGEVAHGAQVKAGWVGFVTDLLCRSSGVIILVSG